MSDIDLTQAVEAGARARWEDIHGATVTWEQILAESPITAANFREDVLPVLAAALPFIEAEMTPAQEIRAAVRGDVAEALAILHEAPNVRVTVAVRWSACWCTNRVHGVLDRADFTEYDGGQLAARRTAERMQAQGRDVHMFRYSDVTAVIRDEVAP